MQVMTTTSKEMKLPSAEEVLNKHYPTEFMNASIHLLLLAAINDHTATHTAQLREELEAARADNERLKDALRTRVKTIGTPHINIIDGDDYETNNNSRGECD